MGGGGVVPNCAIQYLVKTNCNSNTELATLSNVCRHWRKIVQDIIIESIKGRLGEEEEQDEQQRGTDHGDVVKKGGTMAILGGLLLPSMALELYNRRKKRTSGFGERTSVNGDNVDGVTDDMDISSTGKRHMRQQQRQSSSCRTKPPSEEEQFCLAWFAPLNIQIQSVKQLDGDSDDDSFSSDDDSYSDSNGDNYDEDGDDSSSSCNASEQKFHSHNRRDETSSGTTGFGGGAAQQGPTYDLSEDEYRRQERKQQQRSKGISGGLGTAASYRNASKSPKRQHHGGNTSNNRAAVGFGRITTVLSAGTTSVGYGEYPSEQQQQQETMLKSSMGGMIGGELLQQEGADGSSVLLQSCSYEWRGYRQPMDVLIPFGYSTMFVSNVLDAASELVSSSSSTSPAMNGYQWYGGSNNMLNTTNNKTTSSTTSTAAPTPPSSSTNQKTDNDQAKKRRTLSRRISSGLNSKLTSRKYVPTFAVRGATLARPEGYCLCWDDDDDDGGDIGNNDENNRKGGISSSDGGDYDRQQQRRRYRTKRKQRRRQRRRARKKLQREVLPRLILSRKDKRPDQQLLLPSRQSSIEDGSGSATGDYDIPSSSSVNNGGVGKKQRAIQFLNATKQNATILRTPPFQCGTVHNGSLTIFLVGIATEDGCFVSGLRHRLELGHLYPDDARDALIDMSPICLAMDNGGKVGSTQDDGGAEEMVDESSSSYNSDDSSFDCSDECRIKCSCPFRYTNKSGAIDVTTYEYGGDGSPVEEECICRGKTGPGLWHCYTAILESGATNNGCRSIRVDGIEEPVQWGRTAEEENGGGKETAERRSYPSKPYGLALDGLTIGSDHCFDMSLCYGDAVEGEGEGAISELIVFRGSMSLEDVVCMERYLMGRHGIPSPDVVNTRERGVDDEQQKQAVTTTGHTASSFVSSSGTTSTPAPSPPTDQPSTPTTPWQEDEWSRQAHALIAQPGPPWNLTGTSVPLRVAARHRSVAWYRTNPVTGKEIVVSRIGSKYSTGSSDW